MTLRFAGKVVRDVCPCCGSPGAPYVVTAAIEHGAIQALASTALPHFAPCGLTCANGSIPEWGTQLKHDARCPLCAMQPADGRC